ncbi:hypothetical protein J6590_104898, partial [Homalodisca vitripennis]
MAKKRLEWAKGIQFPDDDWKKVQYPQDSVESSFFKIGEVFTSEGKAPWSRNEL